jgi:predicted component of type VI protein secretion system
MLEVPAHFLDDDHDDHLDDDHDDHEVHSTVTPTVNDSDHDHESQDLTREQWDTLVRKDVAEVLNVTLSRVVVASLKQAPSSAATNGICL